MVGGDELVYEIDDGSPTTDMVETKILLNGVISNKEQKARFATIDLKDMFLHTETAKPEYTCKLTINTFPKTLDKI